LLHTCPTYLPRTASCTMGQRPTWRYVRVVSFSMPIQSSFAWHNVYVSLAWFAKVYAHAPPHPRLGRTHRPDPDQGQTKAVEARVGRGCEKESPRAGDAQKQEDVRQISRCHLFPQQQPLRTHNTHALLLHLPLSFITDPRQWRAKGGRRMGSATSTPARTFEETALGLDRAV